MLAEDWGGYKKMSDKIKCAYLILKNDKNPKFWNKLVYKNCDNFLGDLATFLNVYHNKQNNEKFN